jgi:hypothetical protein
VNNYLFNVVFVTNIFFLNNDLRVNLYDFVMNYCFFLLFFMTGWVNRFANVGDTAMEVIGNTASRFRQAKTEIVSASKAAYRFLFCVTNNVKTDMDDSPSNSDRGESPNRVQAALLKNVFTKL